MATISEREKELEAVENRNLRVKLGLKRINYSSLFAAFSFIIAYYLPRVVATKIITIYYYVAGTQIQALTDQISYSVTRYLSDLGYRGLEVAVLVSFVLMLTAAFLEPIVFIVRGPIKIRMRTGLNVRKTRYIMIGLALIVNFLMGYYLLTFKSRVHAHYDYFRDTLYKERRNYLVSTYGYEAAVVIITIGEASVNYTVIAMTVGYYMAVLGRYLAMFAIIAILGAIGKEIEI